MLQFADVLRQMPAVPTEKPSVPVQASKIADDASEGMSGQDVFETVDSAVHTLLDLQNEPMMMMKMSHKEVEQHRRMQAKKYFDELRMHLPGGQEQKNDRNKILAMTIHYIRNLQNGGKVDSPVEDSAEGSPSPSCDMMFDMELDKKDPGLDKRLSHNEVEQRRRLQARKHYEELRSLLPNASKFDKNALLQNAIYYIKKNSLVGVDETVGNLTCGSSEMDSDSVCSHTPSSVGVPVHWQEAMLSESFSSLSSLAQSPSDVTNLSRSLQNVSRRGRKRTPCKANADADTWSPNILSRSAPVVISPLQACEEGHAGLSSDQKKRRTLDTAELLAGLPLSLSPSRGEENAQGQWVDDGDECLDALSLLSQLAVQMSEPNTPSLAPSKPAYCSLSSCALTAC